MTRVRVHCAFCAETAARFFLTLDNTLWCTCSAHAHAFESTAFELDPEQYDLEDYFLRLPEAGERGTPRDTPYD